MPSLHRRNRLFATVLVAVAASRAVTGAATKDVDGDARADLSVFTSDGDWVVRKSTAGFTDSLTGHLEPGYTPVLGDFDGDGRRDFAAYREWTGDWTVKLSSTNFTTTLSINWGGPGYKPVAADYDGDGKADFAVYTEVSLYGPEPGYWYVLKSSANYTTALSRYVGGFGPYGAYIPLAADFDGDGKADMGMYEKLTGIWWTKDSSQNFGFGQRIDWGGINAMLVPGDYDGDGKADAGLYFRGSGRWYIAKSSTSYVEAIDVVLGGADATPVPDDYDGDGKTDPAVCVRHPGVAGTWSARLSSTNFASVQTLFDGFGAMTDIVVTAAITVPFDQMQRAADVNGDRDIADLTVYNPSTDTNWASLLSMGYTTTLTTRAGGIGWAPVPGDFDGDGRADRALYEQSTGRWYVVLSGANFTTTLSISVGGPGWKAVPADYDGDGKTDPAVYQTTTGQWYVLKSGSDYTTTLSIFWGGGGYGVVPADFDGDGLADLGCYLDRNWYMLLSSRYYTTSMSAYFPFGFPGPVGIAADYDGDGLANPGFYNPATGEWYILFQEGPFGTMFNQPSFGGPDWVPVVVDLSGTGRANVAVYNTTTGAWWIRHWSGGGVFTKNWGGPGYVPVPRFP